MLARRSINSSKQVQTPDIQGGMLIPLPEHREAPRLWREATVAGDSAPRMAERCQRAEAALADTQVKLEAERVARAEIATLLSATEHRLASVERVAAEANQRPALKNFLLELNRRMDMLRQRDREVATLTAQLEAAARVTNALREELAAERAQREQLELRVAEVRDSGTESGVPSSVRQTAPAAPDHSGGAITTAARSTTESVLLVHEEEHDGLRSVVQASVTKFGHVTYSRTTDRVSEAARSRAILAINLLQDGRDPWSTISTHVGGSDDESPVFAYCVDGERGFIPGLLDYFSAPFDPNTYAARLLCRGAQRVLTVSEHIDGMAMLRTTLGHAQCSTSVVFDAKQALDLLPMVNPDTVLIDLALPKGEAFRLIARLRAEPKTANVRIGVFFSKPTAPAELAQQARRVANGIPFAPSELAHALVHALGPDGLGKKTRNEQKRAIVRDHQAITVYPKA